jgi:hypothetical protein
MQKQDFDNAIRRQALQQSLSDVLDATNDDQEDVTLFRSLPPNLANFAYHNTRGRLEAPFLSSRQLPSIAQGVSGLLPIPGLPNRVIPSFAWKDYDDFLLAAVEAEGRRLSDLRVSLIGTHPMAALDAQSPQKRHALLMMQQQLQQQQQDTYISFMRSVQPMQTFTPQVMAPSSAPTNTVYSADKFFKAENPVDSTKVFRVLGSSMRGKTDPYIDVSALPVIAGQERQTIRGGVAEPFPQRLYSMLQDVEKQGKSHIASFSPHGRAFAIHDMKAFATEILPKYFAKQSKLVSFLRQLNLYGFARIHSGPDLGGYYHELFLKGRPELFTYMRRTGASKGKEDRRKRKDRHIPAIQPDFYTMKPIRPGQAPAAYARKPIRPGQPPAAP